MAPERSCGITVWYKPSSSLSYVEVVGSWNDWKRPGVALAAADDGWQRALVDLSPGEYQYALVDDGRWMTDPYVGETAMHGEVEVSWTRVSDCHVPELKVERIEHGSNGFLDLQFVRAHGGASLSKVLATWDVDGLVPPRIDLDASTGRVRVAVADLPRGKHGMTVEGVDNVGLSATVRASLWSGRQAQSLRDLVLYQVMVDRFRDANGDSLAPPRVASDRAGGHLDGVRIAVERGEIEAMGFNALWLSPLYPNPVARYPGLDGKESSGYHGYWPTTSQAVDDRLGGKAALDALVHSAHARGLSVIFDIVPNHVHENHSWVTAHPDWFRLKDACVCGTQCSWATDIERCAFATYLPDVNWSHPDAARALVNDALWWLEEAGGDGLRIDAVPMMPRSATRRIVGAVRSSVPAIDLYLLGEHFTGPSGYDSIRANLGPYGLDGAFDFPLMWALRGAIAKGDSTMRDLSKAMDDATAAWGDASPAMAIMLGNHDVARFASTAANDESGDRWTPAVQPSDERIYQRQAFALELLATLPGVPTVYYGDEVALAGRPDPDSRRVMPAEDQLSPAQRRVRERWSAMAHVRASHRSLRHGRYRLLQATDEVWAFAREVDGEEVVIVASREPTANAPVPLDGPRAWYDAQTGENIGTPYSVLASDAYRVRVLVGR